jgi:hypothetical protein
MRTTAPGTIFPDARVLPAADTELSDFSLTADRRRLSQTFSLATDPSSLYQATPRPAPHGPTLTFPLPTVAEEKLSIASRLH